MQVILPDESVLEFEKNPSVYEVAQKISQGLAKNAIAAKVNGEITGLTALVNDKDKVEILTTSNNEALSVLRHSTAHIMAQAVQNLFPDAKLAIGPSIENGFYYDFDIDGHTLNSEDLEAIEKEMHEILKNELFFEQHKIEDVDAEIAKFKEQGEIYKAELIEEHKNESPTLYLTKDKDGSVLWNDFCRGPHLMSSKPIKAFKLLNTAGAYWRGDEHNKMLQRIYATAFFSKKELDEYITQIEEAQKRDHRKLGTQLDLFSVRDEIGAGLVLWHPNLGVVREQLEYYWRSEHRKRGYDIVVSPHIAKPKLWEISGHMDHYKDNMFFVKADDEEYVLKPMNCPFHILIYQANRHSYRDLPLRLAEMGTVYRKERSGALQGLTRVQGFTQDDAHIFLTPEQLVEEINRIIDFVDDALKKFGMTYEVELSTRPDDFTGTLENWERAEAGLKEALDKRGLKYDINEGDGAFYGPKIDFKLKDAIGRIWQCATIQLDFNLPERFDLKYQDKDGQLKTPVMIHRVIFGSLERFVGILIEHYAGAFPLWLAPEQVTIIPIADRHTDYAYEILNKLKSKNIRAHVDERSESMNYKIREAQNKKVPYMLVMGDKEITDNKVAVRKRGEGQIGVFGVDEFVEMINSEM